MPYILKIGLRYLTANKGQSLLLISGVAVGVLVFIFMAALIGGLAKLIVERTVGNSSHITIEAPETALVSLLPRGDAGTQAQVLLLRQTQLSGRSLLRTADAFLPIIEATPGVVVTSQVIQGSGFLVQGSSAAPIALTGVDPAKVSAIAPLGKNLVAGTTDLGGSNMLIASGLADDLGLVVGKAVRLRASTGVERVMTVGGIFDLGMGPGGGGAAYVSLATARALLNMPQGISRIEIKIADVNAADAMARDLRARTGLKVTPWTESSAGILTALQAQAQTGYVVRGFAILTIVIGVASAMMLSTYRRRPEIGIMRAMGATQGFVVLVFVTQGTLIGLLGGGLGALVGFLALLPFPTPENFQTGRLPIDITQGAYGLAVGLTTLGAVLASILPARAAARIDPVQAIGQ